MIIISTHTSTFQRLNMTIAPTPTSSKLKELPPLFVLKGCMLGVVTPRSVLLSEKEAVFVAIFAGAVSLSGSVLWHSFVTLSEAVV